MHLRKDGVPAGLPAGNPRVSQLWQPLARVDALRAGRVVHIERRLVAGQDDAAVRDVEKLLRFRVEDVGVLLFGGGEAFREEGGRAEVRVVRVLCARGGGGGGVL